MTANASTPAKPAASETSAYAWYVAGMLGFAYLISTMDRYILGVVAEDVKASLALTDYQLGILLGPSFVAMFVAASIPFGILTDITNRKAIISGGLLLWSLATAACGLASSFGELLVARLLVGFGEAALLPAAMSLIAAYFSKRHINRGVSIFTAGGSLGRMAGFLGGGLALTYFASAGTFTIPAFGEILPWQAVFLTAGALGVGAALLFFVTIREPAREAGVRRPGSSFASGMAYLWRHKTAYAAIFVPMASVAAMGAILASWTVSFYVREHGLTAPDASMLIGMTSLILGPVVHIGGGWLNDRLGIRGVSGVHPLVLGVILSAVPLSIAGFAGAPSIQIAALFYALSYSILAYGGPTGFTGCQLLTPERYRGVISSVFLIFFMLLGTGLGPFVVAAVSETVLGTESRLGFSITLTTLLFCGLGIPTCFLGRKAFQALSERVQLGGNPDDH